jgi:acyl transferase domain-containing protein
MEAKAIGAVIGENRANGPCTIGSVKTNIGHLEAAAGIAGLIKVVLSLQHRTIPPSLHYHSPNPHIPFDALNLQVQNELKPWPAGSGPALAGVSSFGFGGTNVHVIVREAGMNKQDEAGDEGVDSIASTCHLLPLSATSYEALQSLAGAFREMLAADFSIATKDICHAAGMRRSQYDYRLAVIGNSREELSASLQDFLREAHDPNSNRIPDRQPKLAFVFSGQGGQWYGMGRELLTQEPVFFKAIERIDQAVQAHFGWSLMDVLCAEGESRLDEIDVVQPAIFAIQVALAELWQSYGITPDAVAGHSMGEVAAAHIAGVLNLEDAVQVICRRSRILKPLRGRGSMMATELSPDQAEALLKEYDNDISIAVINSPTSTVLSGNPETLKKVMDALQRQNLFCKWVNVDVASHSPQIDQVRVELLQALDGLHPQRARLPIYSTVTGARGDTTSLSMPVTGWTTSGNLCYFPMRSGNYSMTGIPSLLKSARIPFCSAPYNKPSKPAGRKPDCFLRCVGKNRSAKSCSELWARFIPKDFQLPGTNFIQPGVSMFICLRFPGNAGGIGWILSRQRRKTRGIGRWRTAKIPIRYWATGLTWRTRLLLLYGKQRSTPQFCDFRKIIESKRRSCFLLPHILKWRYKPRKKQV